MKPTTKPDTTGHIRGTRKRPNLTILDDPERSQDAPADTQSQVDKVLEGIPHDLQQWLHHVTWLLLKAGWRASLDITDGGAVMMFELPSQRSTRWLYRSWRIEDLLGTQFDLPSRSPESWVEGVTKEAMASLRILEAGASADLEALAD